MTGAVGDVVAGALAAACRDRDVLARLAGPLGEAVRAAAAGPDAGAWARAARAVIPAGLRGVDPSWLEAALDGLPERARAAVAAGGGDEIAVWLARWATAAIAPMPAITEARVTSLDAAIRVDAATLVAWLEDAGADQLALALGAAGDGAVAAVAQRVGERVSSAAARIALAPRAGALGPVRAAIARCRIEPGERALIRIGARAVGPHTDPLTRLRIALRLPRPLGTIVAGELAAAARLLVADAPTWHALVARTAAPR
jgi:hypothetical protein